MGKRGGWLYAVKRAFSCAPKVKKSDKKIREPGKSFGGQRSPGSESPKADNVVVIPAVPTVHLPMEEVKLMEAENEQNRHAYSVAIATAVAAEAAVAAAHAAAEVVRLTTVAHNKGRTKEEMAAIRIQSVYRGYLSRRGLRALRGLVRLKSLLGGDSVKRQSTSTLKCLQTMSRAQTEIRARRIRMSEANSAVQRQIQQKHEKEQEKSRLSIGENWDDSVHSKDKIEANLQNKQEAAIRRERALAYAYSHQQTWRNLSNPVNQTFMDPNNPRWGWSWLERWMAARPWESGSTTERKESLNGDHGSVKSTTTSRPVSANKQSRPPSRQSPSTPTSKISRRIRPLSSPQSHGTDEDSRSVNSIRSDRCRRHSIAGSSVRDDESLASSPGALYGYMAPTESARAKSRLSTPLGVDKVGTPDKGSGIGSAKKRLSFSGSPAGPRRHSGSPRIDISPSIKDQTTKAHHDGVVEL